MRRLLSAMLTTTAACCFATSASAALLFSDSFDHPDTANYDATSPQDPSQGGPLAGAIEFRSSKSTLDIAGNQLLMPSGTASNSHSRGRFHDQSNLSTRYNFAPAMAAIGGAGQMIVSFDYNITDALLGNDRWVGFAFGTDDDTGSEPNTRVNVASTDLGVIIKAAGTVEYFNNGVATSLAMAHSETGTAVPVSIRISYDSLLEGGNITLQSILVGATETLASPVGGFNWESNGVVPVNSIHLELENRNGPNIIDNFAIQVFPVPEPGAWGLAVASVCGVACMRRRSGARVPC